MIKCRLDEISQFSELISYQENNKKKNGRYHGTMFWDIPGYGTKRWVVATRIIPEIYECEISDSDLVEKCLEFINTPPPRKKYQKKIPKPKYGTLELYRADVKRLDDGIIINALLITEERNNKNFWGKGTIVKI